MKLTMTILTLAIGLGCLHGQVRYYGAVDLGAKGTKAYLYAFEREAEGRDARVIFGKTINTSLVSGAVNAKVPDGSTEMRFTSKGIEEAATAVKELMEMMRASAAENSTAIQANMANARRKVAAMRASLTKASTDPTGNAAEIKKLRANIAAADAGIRIMDGRVKGLSAVYYYVVGSSGVAKGANTPDLANAVKAATAVKAVGAKPAQQGIDMAFVDARQEAQYGLISAVSKARRADSILVDIGSGNTKLGCMAGDSFKSTEIPFGSVTGRKWAQEQSADDLPAGIETLLKTRIAPSYKKEIMNYPCLSNRSHFY
jgi:hypothetical protein